jgi:predicted NAD-dependent protein-ADP-ribosyltransferase YbiA (DUF1768 family)
MTIAFKKVKDAFGWMSNMSPHPLAIEDGNHLKHWRTAEAVFQAMRFDSPSISEAIRECPSPMGAAIQQNMLSLITSITTDTRNTIRAAMTSGAQGQSASKRRRIAFVYFYHCSR